MESLDGAQITNCNAVEPGSPEWWAERMQHERDVHDNFIRNAKRARQSTRSADMCGMCGRQLAPDEPITREDILVGGWGKRRMAVVCRNCRPKPTGYLDHSCETCGRAVFNRVRRHSRHCFCCSRCEWTFFNRKRSEAGQDDRLKDCVVCGERFEARRRDAMTCSSACRQKLFRQRKTGISSIAEPD